MDTKLIFENEHLYIFPAKIKVDDKNKEEIKWQIWKNINVPLKKYFKDWQPEKGKVYELSGIELEVYRDSCDEICKCSDGICLEEGCQFIIQLARIKEPKQIKEKSFSEHLETAPLIMSIANEMFGGKKGDEPEQEEETPEDREVRLDEKTIKCPSCGEIIGEVVEPKQEEQPKEERGNWILCKEEMPTEEVLLLTSSRAMIIGDFYKGSWRTHRSKWVEKDGTNILESAFNIQDIIAWQPLPPTVWKPNYEEQLVEPKDSQDELFQEMWRVFGQDNGVEKAKGQFTITRNHEK